VEIMISHERDDPELARTYDRVSDPQFEGGRRLVERLELGPGDRVLDVGCGTGRLAEWIAGRVGSAVVGVDPLPERIALARARAPALRFEVGRAEDLGAFADASFDAVCLSAAFHWVEDQPRALGEAARVLRPGGRLGITTLARELRRQGTVARVVASVLARPPWREPAVRAADGVRGATLTEIVTMLQQAGLDLLELHVVQRRRRHDGGEDVLAFLESSTFGNFLSAVPGELRPQLRAALVAAFEAGRGPDGIAIEHHAVLLVAERATPRP
jgi:ubiquinone/menaquinone biosynthesis C-methylase UbiE